MKVRTTLSDFEIAIFSYLKNYHVDIGLGEAVKFLVNTNKNNDILEIAKEFYKNKMISVNTMYDIESISTDEIIKEIEKAKEENLFEEKEMEVEIEEDNMMLKYIILKNDMPMEATMALVLLFAPIVVYLRKRHNSDYEIAHLVLAKAINVMNF